MRVALARICRSMQKLTSISSRASIRNAACDNWNYRVVIDSKETKVVESISRVITKEQVNWRLICPLRQTTGQYWQY